MDDHYGYYGDDDDNGRRTRLAHTTYNPTTTCGSTHTRHGIISTIVRAGTARERMSSTAIRRCRSSSCSGGGCAYLFDLILALDHRVREQLHLDLLGGHGLAATVLIKAAVPLPPTNTTTLGSRIVDAHMHQNFGHQTHVLAVGGPFEWGWLSQYVTRRQFRWRGTHARSAGGS